MTNKKWSFLAVFILPFQWNHCSDYSTGENKLKSNESIRVFFKIINKTSNKPSHQTCRISQWKTSRLPTSKLVFYRIWFNLDNALTVSSSIKALTFHIRTLIYLPSAQRSVINREISSSLQITGVWQSSAKQSITLKTRGVYDNSCISVNL